MSNNFSVTVEPGLTLEDTKFKVAGDPIVFHGYFDYAFLLAKAYGQHKYPDAKGFGSQSRLTGAQIAPIYDHKKSTVTLSPKALRHSLWDNSDGQEVAHHSATLNDQTTVGTTVGWSDSTTVGGSFTVGVEIGVTGEKTSASATYSVSTTEGHTASYTKTVGVGATEAVSVDVPPGEVVLAVLLINDGTLSADLKFQVQLRGEVIVYIEHTDGTQTYDIINATEWSYLIDLPSVTMNACIDFVGEDVTKTLNLPDGLPSTVDSYINKAKAELTGGHK